MPRPLVQNVQTVACVGAGTIGAAWAAYFLSRGLTVVATDPEPAAKAHLMDTVESIWSRLQQLSPCPQADQANLSFTDDLEAAVEGAEFIQESAPDDESLKIKLLRRIGEASPADSVIASSSSTFLTIRYPVSYAICDLSLYGAGIAAQPVSDMPSASAIEFILEAVPIVLQ